MLGGKARTCNYCQDVDWRSRDLPAPKGGKRLSGMKLTTKKETSQRRHHKGDIAKALKASHPLLRTNFLIVESWVGKAPATSTEMANQSQNM
jgi:hypothetical protein